MQWVQLNQYHCHKVINAIGIDCDRPFISGDDTISQCMLFSYSITMLICYFYVNFGTATPRQISQPRVDVRESEVAGGLPGY